MMTICQIPCDCTTFKTGKHSGTTFELLTPSVKSEEKGIDPPGYAYNPELILSHWTTLSGGNHLPD